MRLRLRLSNLPLPCAILFRLSASHFLMLAPQKVTKEEGTQPSRLDGFLALLGVMGWDLSRQTYSIEV